MATNLRFINKTIVSEGVTTVNVDNIFTSEYDVYFCQVVGLYHNVDVSNGTEGLRFIDVGGSVITGNEYAYALLNCKDNNTFSESRSNVDDNIFMVQYGDQLSQGQSSVNFYIYNPANTNSYTYTHNQANGVNSSGGVASKGIGVHKSQEIIRGFQLYESNSAREFGGGVINVYGVK